MTVTIQYSYKSNTIQYSYKSYILMLITVIKIENIVTLIYHNLKPRKILKFFYP